MAPPRPLARSRARVVQPAGDELLVYDLERHRAYILNRTSPLVWRLCEGAHPLYTRRQVTQALATLGLAAALLPTVPPAARPRATRSAVVPPAPTPTSADPQANAERRRVCPPLLSHL